MLRLVVPFEKNYLNSIKTILFDNKLLRNLSTAYFLQV